MRRVVMDLSNHIILEPGAVLEVVAAPPYTSRSSCKLDDS